MKQKMTKDIVPEGFTLKLALVDAIPVIFFGLSCVFIGMIFSSWIFILGGSLCLIGGTGKVLWKIIVATSHKNIWFLFVQMRILMPLGFLLMIISLIAGRDRIDFEAMKSAILAFPQVIFFCLGIIGMIMMGVFAAKLDSSDVKSNWIEQFTNGLSQFFFFLGLLLIYLGF